MLNYSGAMNSCFTCHEGYIYRDRVYGVFVVSVPSYISNHRRRQEELAEGSLGEEVGHARNIVGDDAP